MTSHLNADISFCTLDGRLFFLDIQCDRYFQLSSTLEHGFLSYLKAPENASTDVSAFIRYNLLSDATAMPYDSILASIDPPCLSILEMPSTDGPTPLRMLLDIFLIVAMTHWQLKTQRLKSILQALIKYRETRTSLAARTELELQRHLSEAATAFNRVRPYVPIETCCLIDSLSMVKFLAKRGLHANLVMGVACDPFSAHAWVQHGPLVLNETVGSAQAHVPIRVI